MRRKFLYDSVDNSVPDQNLGVSNIALGLDRIYKPVHVDSWNLQSRRVSRAALIN